MSFQLRSFSQDLSAWAKPSCESSTLGFCDKGPVTTYDYNERGLEISRTEATGTTLARTTTIEWDPDRFLPIKVIEPNRVTVYSYNNQGCELTRQRAFR
ncbi:MULTISPECIES: sugar-binding protein [Pseudomonas syringae group]|uniref:YD repeat protein n=1 Tax=Pseudomonas savastanoi TaxID=29438 RepID=A0A3M5G631_PSESS|nr:MULTISPECIES: sugar-binding protein [Pseudomonas syringae group]RMS81977.1 YD repeat protein [Pseudomonas savastanoi]SOS16759.1 hypothetical protein CFBP6109_02039 [Pseudomonas syringae pv. cerasicola]SPF15685.1 hypothetical protein PSCFBP6110_03193 [Pseudomonas syringae pv. cerasicola]